MDQVSVALTAGLGAALLTGVAQYLSAVLPAKRAAREARAANALAREQAEREWLTHVAEMCRSDDQAERRIGLRFLRATLRDAPESPIGRALLDELTQEYFGRTLNDATLNLGHHDQLALLPPADNRKDGEPDAEDPDVDS